MRNGENSFTQEVPASNSASRIPLTLIAVIRLSLQTVAQN